MDAVNLSGSLLCPRCQTGLNALLLDPLEPMCPYMSCHNGNSCSQFRQIVDKSAEDGLK